MSSKLEQALARLDQVVEALEHTPKVEPAAEAGGVPSAEIKAEVAAIRGLVDDAMAALTAHQQHQGDAS